MRDVFIRCPHSRRQRDYILLYTMSNDAKSRRYRALKAKSNERDSEESHSEDESGSAEGEAGKPRYIAARRSGGGDSAPGGRKTPAPKSGAHQSKPSLQSKRQKSDSRAPAAVRRQPQKDEQSAEEEDEQTEEAGQFKGTS